MAQKTAPRVAFDDQLVLFRYFMDLLKLRSVEELGATLNRAEYEGFDDSGHTRFCNYISGLPQTTVTQKKLLEYDENIRSHTARIGKQRKGFRWKYFQYIALLFTEIYLDRYFSDADKFCAELNVWLDKVEHDPRRPVRFEKKYTPDKLNKLAFMCATGSGKTLIMHMNILQFQYYLDRAKKLDSGLSMNKIIVLAPNEGMSRQHLTELEMSSIPAAMFEKDKQPDPDKVIIIDMGKLKEEGKIKTVSVDSFEQNNLVLVDEGHRGLTGNVWYDYRTRLSEQGFAFEYSATFKQALKANAAGNTQQAKDEQALMEEYGKSIIMDYSYKYFYNDGYGKDYRIFNLKDDNDDELKYRYLTGCLLSFYQQLKVFSEKGIAPKLKEFNIEKPLLVFVGNRVTTPVGSGKKSEAETELLTDVLTVLVFIDRFLRRREETLDRISAVLNNETGLIDGNGKELFGGAFKALEEFFGKDPDPEEIFKDIRGLVFNTGAEEPRLRVENLRQIPGEIGLKVGKYDDYFGVINIGDTPGMLKRCEDSDIIVDSEEIVSNSLFRNINRPDSKIQMLIGSRKFAEGWNSWRVSTMGLINFAKGKGSQAIQLFGRGVRLKGYAECLKRSDRLDDTVTHPTPPDHIRLLETLTIFGVMAKYMEEFKSYLEQEGVPPGETIREYRLPVIDRFEEVKDKQLRVIRVKGGADFTRKTARVILDKPDDGFSGYLGKSRTIIDCRSRIQTIQSNDDLNMASQAEPKTLPPELLKLLDLQRIFEELLAYKSEKRYFNIIIVKEKLLGILGVEWYGLLLPEDRLEIDSMAKLETATDHAVKVLKHYMDKFFNYEMARWEAPLLEYAILNAADGNFIDGYTLSYTPQGPTDTTGKELKAFVEEMSKKLQTDGGLGDYSTEALQKQLVLLDLPSHLYAPLVCCGKSDLKIQISPVALNADERRFVDRLKEYADTKPAELQNKSLYLLRNRPKTGIGFFEAGNFYPDFILWIDTPEKQYITFVDPKGLLQIGPEDPKIEFCKTIKELEKRLAPSAKGKKIILNSFIMSGTSFFDLQNSWKTKTAGAKVDRAYLEARNVYMLNDDDCVESMINKILKD